MGKASILVIPVTIVVVGLIIWGIIWMVKRTPKNVSKLQKQAVLADEAMELFKSLMVVSSLDTTDMDILSEKSKKNIKAWAEKYRKVNS